MFVINLIDAAILQFRFNVETGIVVFILDYVYLYICRIMSIMYNYAFKNGLILLFKAIFIQCTLAL